MKTVIASLVVLCAATLTAQVSETIDVRIVNVDVTVSSKGGPVRGLTRDDFEVFEDGRRQAITNFYATEEENQAVARATTAASVPAAAAAPAEPDPRFRRKVLVLVDNRHTTRRNRDTALRELEAMINDRFHGQYEWSIGVMGRAITLVLPLSSDKQAIHEALEIIRKSGTRGEGTTTFTGAREADTPETAGIEKTNWSAFDGDYANRLEESAAMDASERTIAAKFTVPAYLDAVRGFASTSGRKIILLLTGDPGLNPDDNFPHQPGNAEFTSVRGRNPSKALADRNIMDDLRRSIVEEANASDTSFYIWNVEGLIPRGELGVGMRPATDTSAISWLSNQTGGRLVTGNDAARAVREFDTASSTFYSLGYSPTHPDDGKYHAISVRLKRKGDYKMEYRTGYSSNPTATQLERAMKSPTAAAMQPTGLPVTLAMGTPSSDRNEVTVPIEVKVPFRSLQFLPGKSGMAVNIVVYVSVFDDIGRNLVSAKIPLAPGFKTGDPDLNGMLVWRNKITMTKGERNRVVVAIRDTVTDSIGMATQVVKF